MPTTRSCTAPSLDRRSHFARWRAAGERRPLEGEQHLLADGGLAVAVFLLGLLFLPRICFGPLSFVLVMLLNYVSAWGVARQLLRDGVGAILAATLFSFVRLADPSLRHLCMHFPTPLLFLAVVRLSERPGWRWPVLAGGCLALQLCLSADLGYLAILMLTVLLLTLVWLRPRRLGDLHFRQRLIVAAGTAALLLLVGSVFAKVSCGRWVGPGMETEHFSLLRAQAGWLVWVLSLPGVLLLRRQWRGRPCEERSWLLCCCVLPLVLLALLFAALAGRLLGFQQGHYPALLVLAACWPSSLLAGWSLAQATRILYPHPGWRRSFLGLAVVVLLLLGSGAVAAGFLPLIQYFHSPPPTRGPAHAEG